jgi:hypothetical protein
MYSLEDEQYFGLLKEEWQGAVETSLICVKH